MGDVMDDVDALGFFKKNKENEEESTTPSVPTFIMPTVDKDSDYYKMDHPKRGLAVIFNHFRYDDYSLSKRDGTVKDCKDLTRTFEKLQFEVVVYHDLKFGSIDKEIDKLVSADHTKSDCLVVVVLTHGDSGRLHARDHQYPPDLLWKSFAGDKCPTLAGKPKLFFIQACRGEEVDGGVHVRARAVQTDSAGSYTIPVMSDILVMYSTYDGFFSWRSPISGSWFIQCLCLELDLHCDSKDLMSILTFVNRRMAISYQSNVPQNKNMHEKKQIGTITSTLTRLLYFYAVE